MVNRVVSTKLTEEEHTMLLDACNKQGGTPSSFIRAALLNRLTPDAEKPNGVEETVSTQNITNETRPKEQCSLKTPESEMMKFLRLCQKQRMAREKSNPM